MSSIRDRLHQLIDQLPEPELEKARGTLQTLYWDSVMVKAIEESKKTLTPGDILTLEEAIQALLSYDSYDASV